MNKRSFLAILCVAAFSSPAQGDDASSAKGKYVVWVYKSENGQWVKQEERTLATDDAEQVSTYVAQVKNVMGWTATSNLPESPKPAETYQFAEESDPVAATLGLTPANHSLPGWTKPSAAAIQDLEKAVKTLNQGVMLLGTAQAHGTGFVISRKYRLVATNAHVADIFHENGTMMAIRNDTSVVYTVDQVWYHPGVLRTVNGSVILRRPGPKDGEVYPRCPDVAVLHLADGPELPEELALATVQEVDDCFAKPIAMLGFPGHDTEGWPGIGDKAAATLREGIVCRLSDFHGGVDETRERLQYIQHSLTSWFGFSGSPLVLPNGHVVAINNSAQAVKKGEHQIELAFGIRIDCLWELLGFHHLDSKVPVPIDAKRLALDRFEKPSKEDEEYSKAIQLVKEANYLTHRKDYPAAVARCTEAIELCPGMLAAYTSRSTAHSWWAGSLYQNFWPPRPQSAEYIQLRESELADDKRRLQLKPNDVSIILDFADDLRTVDMARAEHSYQRQVIEICDKILNSTEVSNDLRAETYVTRANARDERYPVIQDTLDDFAKALRADPYCRNAYKNRAQFEQLYDSWRYAADMRKVNELDSAENANFDAWRLATSANASDRDGHKAWDLAVKACTSTDYAVPAYVNTLAAAYAECGDFEMAQKYEKDAIKLAPAED